MAALALPACSPPATDFTPTPAFFSGIGKLQAVSGGYGTAFPVAHTEDGFIVMTCRHVVEGAHAFNFILPGKTYGMGKTHWVSPGTIDWGSDSGADAALVRFKSEDRPSLYRLSEDRGAAFSTAWVAGWPNSVDKLQVNKGIFQADRRRLDGSVAPGSSGSPVFNSKGEVVGLVSMVWRPETVNGWGQRNGMVNWSWVIQMSDVRLAEKLLRL